MATAGPACARCGWTLRWFQPQYAWVCDRCRAVYPAAARAVRAGRAGRGGAAAMPGSAVPAGLRAATMPGAAAPAATPWRPSRREILLAGGAAALAVVAIVAVIVLRGGASGAAVPKTRKELIDRAVAALAAHDVDALVRLADYDTLRAEMLDCEDTAEARDAAHKNLDELRDTFDKEVERTRRAELALAEIASDLDDESKPTTLARGESAGVGCKFKIDAAFHDLKFTLKVTLDGKTRTQVASMIAIEARGGWHLLGPPRIQGELGISDCKSAVTSALAAMQDELLKVPNMTQTKIDGLNATLVERCESDYWSEETRTCLEEAHWATSVEACMTKLPLSQMTAITDAIGRAATGYP